MLTLDSGDGTPIIITNVNCSVCCWHNGTATISADGHHITDLLAHASDPAGCAITGTGEVRENSVLTQVDVDYSYDELGYEIKWAVKKDSKHGSWPAMTHDASSRRARFPGW